MDLKKRHIKEIILILSVISCSVIAFECSRAAVVSLRHNLSETEAESDTEAGTVTEQLSKVETISESVTENIAPNDKTYSNEHFFYEHTDEQGIDRREADKYWDMLLTDNIFKDDTMQLTGLVVDDMDDNGLNDLLVMIIDHENWAIHGSGCVWIYMNEDEPCCFDAEAGSYYGDFEFFAEDIDNDDNTELVLSTHGWGTGFPDTYKAVFKYKDHDLKRMELPSDIDKDDEWGIHISVIQEADKNRYSAYCSYFDEEIFFEAENAESDKSSSVCYGNVRGFMDLHPIEYQGKNALQASDYLAGEGGWTHLIATAEFIILWDENGRSYVDSWWIEVLNDSENSDTDSNAELYTNLDTMEIYERFLNGELAVEKEGEQVHISELFWDNDIEYCFLDIDDDSSEELHIRDNTVYYIIKVSDKTPQIILENWWGYEPVVTGGLCGILYYSHGYGAEHVEFIKICADGSRESDGEFRWYDDNRNGSMDKEDSFDIDYIKDISMEQYVQYKEEQITKKAENELEWTDR